MKLSLTAAILCTLLLGYAHAAWSADAEPAKQTTPATAEAAKQATPATYVGNEVCQACHVQQTEKFSQTVMGKIFLHNPRNETEKQVCESCHGPGSNHVAAGGGKGVGGLITFRKDSSESAKVQNEACLQCHQKGIQTYWNASPHASRGIACVNCHTLMEKTSDRYQLAKVGEKTPFFNRRAEIEVCGQCHLQRQAQLMRSSHMPVREGKLVCTSCHNPHGTPNPKQLIQATTNENCLSCHTERRGPFLWEHPPVIENCANCHEPHGSSNPQLLKTRMPRVCDSCHVASRHPTQPQPLSSIKNFNRGCTNCHSAIHGSNSPSGDKFLR